MITELQPNEVFVFGSNLAGRHGAGAAKQALQWGAKYGKGWGRYGQTYALPTKDAKLEPLRLNLIKNYVDIFLHYAKSLPRDRFLVTAIGCGLAGYNPEHIAPMFITTPANVILPPEFVAVISKIRQG